MGKIRLPRVGDVIKSKRFVYGRRDYFERSQTIYVGADEPDHIISRSMTDEEIVQYVKAHNRLPSNKWVNENLGVPDETRATAEFVVIRAVKEGGGTGHGQHDIYPDGWHVTAKRLNSDQQWDENGEVIEFYMTGSFIDLIPPEEVEIVRKMSVTFVK